MTFQDKSNIKITRKLLAVGIPCLIGWTFSVLAIFYFKEYTFGLFAWLPTVLGMLSTIISGYHNEADRIVLRNVSYLTLGVFSLGLLTFAMEGVICILMAAPIGVLFVYIGHWFGYFIVRGKMSGNLPTVIIFFSLSVPAFMSFEHAVTRKDELRSVTTSVEINAPIFAVWKNVIHFAPLDKPHEFIFNAGIAYPISAQINGLGAGAIRHCNFSTGTFTEPITIWKEPNLLEFKVDNQPEPLKEISFYNIHPNHLHGYWVSEKGQFKLTALSNGHTVIEGTTWYINKISPGFYWTIWSDYIVHKIHQRVLQHIKDEAEKKDFSYRKVSENSNQ